MRLQAAVLISLGLAVPAAAQEPEWPRPLEGCVECHRLIPAGIVSRPTSQVAGDAHGRAGIGCAGCHGGNPAVSHPAEAAHDPAMGFLPVARLEDGIVGRCGACHAGPRREYLAGVHRPAEGRKVPNCLTCHYADHLTRTDFRAIADRERCGGCHEPGPVLEFRRAFEDAQPELARAREIASDSLEARESSRRSGLPSPDFERAAEELVAARIRFLDTSHRARILDLEAAAGDLETRAAALEPLDGPPERAREPLFVYLTAGVLVLAAVACLALSRRL